MLVGERMSHPIIAVRPELPIVDALDLMRREKISRAPVIKNGKLIGIVSEHDILNASPSQVTTLSVWEMNYLLSKITINNVMSRTVHTVTEDTPIETAARLMADTGVGGLPVMRGENVVGMITETDLFKIFLELMGAREVGVRVTALVHEERGQLANLSKAIADAGGNFLAFGAFSGEHPNNRLITFKVEGMEEDQLTELITPLVEELIDIRIC